MGLLRTAITSLFGSRPAVVDHVNKANDAVEALKADVQRVRAGDILTNSFSGLGGGGDKSTYSTWSPVAPVDRASLEFQFRSDWLSRQIVTVPAADATREWVDHKSATPDFVKKMKEAEKKFHLRNAVYDGEWTARLYGGAVMLLGVSDGADPLELREPFDYHKTKPGQLRYLRVLDRWRAQGTGALDSAIESPNFDYPEFYALTTSDIGGVQVHHTRVIRFDGDVLPWYTWIANNRWSDSVLQSSNEAIKAVNTAMQAVVSMLHEANFDIVKSPDLAAMMAQGRKADLQERWALASMMKSWMRVLVLDASETFETRQRTFSEISNIIEKLQITVSGAADIPFTRLYGQSPAGLTATGESDLQNYYNAISSGQETKLRPRLEVLFEILALSECGGLPDDYDFCFRPLWKEPDSTKATTETARATAANAYVTMGAIMPSTVAKKLKTAGEYEITDEEIEDLIEAEANPPEPQYPDGMPPAGGPPGEGGEPVDPTKEDSEGPPEGGGLNAKQPPAKSKKPAFGKAGDSLTASPKDALILCAADEVLDAFDEWSKTYAFRVVDAWQDQERDEAGRFGFGSGPVSQARKEHVATRNEFAASTKAKNSLRDKKKRAEVALSKAIESGHAHKIQAAAQRLHEHATAHAEHMAKHAEVKARVKATTKALKASTKTAPAPGPAPVVDAPVAPPGELPAGHTLSGNVTKEHLFSVHTHLKPGILAHIEKSGAKTVFTDKIVHRDGANTSNATGLFTPNLNGGAHQIQVLARDQSNSANTAIPPRQGGTFSISSTQGGAHRQAITLTHEGAHNAMRNMVDHARATRDPKEIALLDEFHGAYEASKAAGKALSFSKYSHKSPGEFVAESVAAYHHEPAYLKSVDPRAYQAAHAFVAHTGYGTLQK